MQIVEGSKLQLVPVDFVNVMQQKFAVPVPAAAPTPHTSDELVSVGSAPLVHENPCPLQPDTVALVHAVVEGALLLDEHAAVKSTPATRNENECARKNLIEQSSEHEPKGRRS